MACRHSVCLGLLMCVGLVMLAPADEPKTTINANQFRRISILLLEDPVGEKAQDLARLIALYVIETPDAAVVLGQEEMKWTGKDDKRKWILFAAYLAGNAQSQLHSGVKRNDRYSGLLHLFQAYRTMQAKDKDFRIADVDHLLTLHKDDKLISHLIELEKKEPTKLSPEHQAELKKLLQGKK
jgi:hypothetical protein